MPTYARPAGRAAAFAVAGAGALLLVRSALRRRRAVDLTDATVLVTGGSRGLGYLLALEFARRGAHVAICARDGAAVERASAELARRTGGDVLAFRCDVADREEVERMVAACLRAWGSVDVLVNNAGVIQVGPLACMTHDDFEHALDVHVRGPLNTVLATLPSMRRRGGGRIVNVASIGGRVPIPHMAPYCASKFGLIGLSEALRVELSREKILVTTVTPGLLRTGSAVHAEFKGRNEREFAWFAVSSSLPIVSRSGTRAARRIVEACRRGEATVTLPLLARAAELAHAFAPRATAAVLSGANRLLPDPGRLDGSGTRGVSGSESRPGWLPRWTTALADRAGRGALERGNGRPDAAGGPGREAL